MERGSSGCPQINISENQRHPPDPRSIPFPLFIPSES